MKMKMNERTYFTTLLCEQIQHTYISVQFVADFYVTTIKVKSNN